jgi:RNA polymerase sigma-70 factor (ECF subfamily)
MMTGRKKTVDQQATITINANTSQDQIRLEFEHLLHNETDSLLRLAFRLLGNQADAQDLVQESLLKAHQSLASFRGEASLKSWVYRIVVNQGLKKLRRRKLVKKVADWIRPHQGSNNTDFLSWGNYQTADPEESASLKQQVFKLQSALEKLSPRQRAVFTLRYLQEYSIADIAQIMGISPGTVKTHLVRAVHQVRLEKGDL